MKKVCLTLLAINFIYTGLFCQCPCVYGRSIRWTNATGNNQWGDKNNWALNSVGVVYDTCGGQPTAPRYCDNVLIAGGNVPDTISVGQELVIGAGTPRSNTSVCKNLYIDDAIVNFTGSSLTIGVFGVTGGLSLLGVSEMKTYSNGLPYISGSVGINGGYHPLPNRFNALTMQSYCAISAGNLQIAGETEIDHGILNAYQMNLGSINPDIEIAVNADSKLYGNIYFVPGKVKLIGVSIYPRNIFSINSGFGEFISSNCNIIIDTLIAGNSVNVNFAEEKIFGGNIYSNKKNSDFRLTLNGSGSLLRYINGEVKIDAGILTILSPYHIKKLTVLPSVVVNVNSNITIN